MGHDAFSKCHPLVNFAFFVGALGLGVVIQHPAYIAVGCAAAAVYYLLLNGKKGIKRVLAMIPVFLFIAAINPLFNRQGETVLLTVLGGPYTLEALFYGMAVAGIFVVMMLWFGCYNAVLTSDKFVCLFGSVIPALSLLLVMVLRMIPNLIRKGRQIIAGRRCVGKNLDLGDAKERLNSGVTVISALTDWALEGSIVTADSMRARGYGTARRTSFQIYRMTVRDWVMLAVMAVLAAAVLAAGNFEAAFTPRFIVSPVTWGLGAYCLFLLIPVILHVREVVQWRISISKI